MQIWVRKVWQSQQGVIKRQENIYLTFICHCKQHEKNQRLNVEVKNILYRCPEMMDEYLGGDATCKNNITSL